MKKRILVVEDDRPILAALVELLDEEGYKVIGAGNGQEALEYLVQAAELPHLILLDLMMPVLDGIQFRAEQKKNPNIAGIPVVLMTADAHFESKKSLIEAKHYLRKPLDIENLLEVIKQHCQ